MNYSKIGIFAVFFIALAILAFTEFSPTSAQTFLACSPAVATATVGQSFMFSATGGTGSYTWSAPDLTLVNPTGSGFTVNYATPGVKTITVTSGTSTANCILNVLAAATTTTTTIGLPGTGGGGAALFQ